MKYGTPSEVPLLCLLLILVEVVVVVQGTRMENKVHMTWVSVTDIPIVQSDSDCRPPNTTRTPSLEEGNTRETGDPRGGNDRYQGRTD